MILWKRSVKDNTEVLCIDMNMKLLTGPIIELYVLTMQIVALSLPMEVCLANYDCQRRRGLATWSP